MKKVVVLFTLLFVFCVPALAADWPSGYPDSPSSSTYQYIVVYPDETILYTSKDPFYFYESGFTTPMVGIRYQSWKCVLSDSGDGWGGSKEYVYGNNWDTNWTSIAYASHDILYGDGEHEGDTFFPEPPAPPYLLAETTTAAIQAVPSSISANILVLLRTGLATSAMLLIVSLIILIRRRMISS